MLWIVVGAPFAGKDRWISREIERREADGEVGLISLSYSGIYGAVAPGAESTYRDSRITDSGAARFAAYVLAAAVREANTRELSGYVAVDSPRRALAAVQQSGGSQVVEVVVTQETALRRSQQHVELIRDLAPRAGADDAKAAAAKCRQMVRAYFDERGVLDSVDVRQVTAPDVPSDNAIRYAWTAAIKAAKRNDTERRDKWTSAARRMLAARGVNA